VHIKDVCSAFISGIEAPASIVAARAFNVGVLNGNFTVKDIAEAAQRAVPGSELIFTGEHTDPRTYRVSFKRILTELKDYYKPQWDLDRGGKELVDFFRRTGFSEKDFRGRNTIRLKQLMHLQESNSLDGNFRLLANKQTQ
jgi:nucleoside-diphosphate-sugar epimerase